MFRIPSLPLPDADAVPADAAVRSRRNRNGVIKRLSSCTFTRRSSPGGWALRYARRYGVPLVYTYHTQLEAYAHYVPFEPNATRFAASRLTRAFANLADAVIVADARDGARLRELGVTVRIEIVPSGIDVASLRRRAPRRARCARGSAPRAAIACCSASAGWHGRRTSKLILRRRGAPVTPRCELVIAGDGPRRRELEQRARGMRGRRRGALSWVSSPRDELPDLYASADAFVMPSTTETQGLVQAEALAAGAAVIAADAPQNRDVLGGAGAWSPPTRGAFARAFARLGLPARRCRRRDRAAVAAVLRWRPSRPNPRRSIESLRATRSASLDSNIRSHKIG